MNYGLEYAMLFAVLKSATWPTMVGPGGEGYEALGEPVVRSVELLGDPPIQVFRFRVDRIGSPV